MPYASETSWTGLLSMIEDLDSIRARGPGAVAAMTDELGTETYLRYIENLEGAVPSTAENPLPVGIRSGDLIGQAQLIRLNQYAFEVTNSSGHAGFIEDGTEKMVARHPLQDAVDILEIRTKAEMDSVMTQIWKL